jgi:excinuclease ABC subunit C
MIEDGGPFPDLILIDGGKGQLSAAYEALETIGLGNLVAVGIAKKEELLFTRDQADAIALPDNDPALLLLQRIRDEGPPPR